MKTIVLEDKWQDFLEFDIKDNYIVDCRPFQAAVWVGKKIVEMPKVGEHLILKGFGMIKYKVIDIKEANND